MLSRYSRGWPQNAPTLESEWRDVGLRETQLEVTGSTMVANLLSSRRAALASIAVVRVVGS